MVATEPKLSQTNHGVEYNIDKQIGCVLPKLFGNVNDAILGMHLGITWSNYYRITLFHYGRYIYLRAAITVKLFYSDDFLANV